MAGCVFYGVPQELFLCLEYRRLLCAVRRNLSGVSGCFLFPALCGAVFPVCNLFWRGGEQLHLVQFFMAAHIHDRLLEECQVFFRNMVFVSGAGIAWPLHKIPVLHIKFSDAVDYNMRVDVPAAVMPVRVGADKRLVSGKIFFCIFQPKLLCAFPGKPFVRILWIIAYNVVVGFDFIITLVFAEAGIQFHAFRIKSERFTVYAVQKIIIP